MSVRASKNDLIRELFVRTADENYIAARWCAGQKLDADFLWLAVHALEKYLKAALLSNARTSKGYGHDIVRLFGEVKALAGGLLPQTLCKPASLVIELWQDRSAEDFVAHMSDNGNADNRYAIYGYVTSTCDLHMLDQMVFAIRRLACVLDGKLFATDDPSAPSITNRDFLISRPDSRGHLNLPLDKLVSAEEDTALRRAALNLNLSFAPAAFAHQPMPARSSASNPVIIRRVLDPLESGDPGEAAHGIALAEWLLDNVQVPKGPSGNPGVTEQLRDALKSARGRHGLP